MYDACPGLNIVDIMARKGAPRCRGQCIARASPIIDANRAVAEIGHCALYSSRYGRILERVGMDEQRDVERAPEPLVGEGCGARDIFRDVCSFKRGLGEEAAESLRGKADIVLLLGIEAGDERPGDLPAGRRAELLGLRVLVYKSLPALLCPRIIGVACGNQGQQAADLLQERFSLLPEGMLDDNAGGVTIEAGVIGEHRD